FSHRPIEHHIVVGGPFILHGGHQTTFGGSGTRGRHGSRRSPTRGHPSVSSALNSNSLATGHLAMRSYGSARTLIYKGAGVGIESFGASRSIAATARPR